MLWWIVGMFSKRRVYRQRWSRSWRYWPVSLTGSSLNVGWILRQCRGPFPCKCNHWPYSHHRLIAATESAAVAAVCWCWSSGPYRKRWIADVLMDVSVVVDSFPVGLRRLFLLRCETYGFVSHQKCCCSCSSYSFSLSCFAHFHSETNNWE